MLFSFALCLLFSLRLLSSRFYFFWTYWQELCLSIKIGKKVYVEARTNEIMVSPPPISMWAKRNQMLSSFALCLPLSLRLLAAPFQSCCRNSPISLFPYIPKGVDYYPIKPPTLRSWHFCCRVFPPWLDMGGVCILLLLDLSEVFPRENLIPNRLCKRANKA